MTDTRSKEMTRLAITALEDKKAEDISIDNVVAKVLELIHQGE